MSYFPNTSPEPRGFHGRHTVPASHAPDGRRLPCRVTRRNETSLAQAVGFGRLSALTGVPRRLIVLVRIGQNVRDALRTVVWRQWNTLGASVPGEAARAGVDPEALVLTSLALMRYEPRLEGVVAWWAARGATLLSVQRLKNLRGGYPPVVLDRSGSFARSAIEEGGDFRWRSIAAGPGRGLGPPTTGAGEPTLLAAGALTLRLRRGIGVGIKADVLGRLLMADGAWCGVRELAETTGYSKRAVRRATGEMAQARLVIESRRTPTRYRVVPGPWMELLRVKPRMPAWRSWAPVFAFATTFLEWMGHTGMETASPYVLGRKAEALVEVHRPAFELNRLEAPLAEGGSPAEYVERFARGLERIAGWLRASA